MDIKKNSKTKKNKKEIAKNKEESDNTTLNLKEETLISQDIMNCDIHINKEILKNCTIKLIDNSIIITQFNEKKINSSELRLISLKDLITVGFNDKEKYINLLYTNSKNEFDEGCNLLNIYPHNVNQLKEFYDKIVKLNSEVANQMSKEEECISEDELFTEENIDNFKS